MSGEAAASGLLDAVVARQGLVAHLAARQMADLAELSRVYPEGTEWLATELALALSVAESTAQTYLHEAVETMRRVPATFAALDAGGDHAAVSVYDPTRSDMRRSSGVNGPVIRICGSSK